MTQQDIENGKAENNQWCPIALAVKRVSPKDSYITVLGSIIYISQAGSGSRFKCGYKPLVRQRDIVSDFIRKFDTGRSVKPLPPFTIRKQVIRSGDLPF